ncbi:hypothetical protein ACFXD5_28705 [Streptomyces sp. NPDC059385]|uniref:hypothetical protein n=1 Tax=Streptomyces sp. NPDC059385 TaxID=3346817 RepID=UPI0036A0BD7F
MTEPQNETNPAPEVTRPAADSATPVTGAAETLAVAETPAAAEPPAGAGSEAVVAQAEPARRQVDRKRVTLAAAGLGVILLVGAGAWGAFAVADADRTSPTRYWTAEGVSPGKGETPPAVPSNELTGKLLPVPSGFRLGPDLAGDGNNFFVSGEAAVESLKEARNGLSSTDRKKRDEAFAKLKLKGVAGRSYTKDGGGMGLEVSLMQADPAALGQFSEMSKKLFDLLGDGRDAPKVDGYPDAKCSLLAIGEEKKEKIDSIDCVAVQGDVLARFHAYGPKPFSASEAAEFFKNQLNHLKTPGESV